MAGWGTGACQPMNAVLDTAVTSPGVSPSLLPPFARLSDVELLEHFRAAGGGAYSPIVDAEEASLEKIDAIVAGTFTFNAESHLLGDRFDWLTNPSSDVEWHILLHKFYYATGLGKAFAESGEQRYVQRWMALTASWMEQTPCGFIAADVTGRRVQNWIYAHWYFVRTSSSASVDPAFHRSLLGSLERQVDFLCKNLTPKRNHRTLELYAIFLAGIAFPELRDAAYWRSFGLTEFARNIEADLLPDGVHCELSTDYHHLVLKNALCVRTLAGRNGVAVPPSLDACLVRALEFSMHAHKPDGVVPSLSDGDARSFLDLLVQGHDLYGREDMLYVATQGAQGRMPTDTTRVFADSGYVTTRSGWGNGVTPFTEEQYLVFDCGPLGEGNHGHLDCLSFEFAAGGRSLVVDPGRYTYSEAGETNWRVHFRGTAAHNTVTVDGRNQTRYEPKAVAPGTRHRPGSTRHRIAGPAPRAELLWCAQQGEIVTFCGRAFSAEYDVVHTRCMVVVGTDYVVVLDHLKAHEAHRYEARFQLSEHALGATTVVQTDTGIRIESPGLTIVRPGQQGALTGIEAGHVSYRYGHKHAAPVVRTQLHARTAWLSHVLVAGEPSRDVPRVDLCAVEPEVGGTSFDGILLSIDKQGTRDLVFVNPDAMGRWATGGEVFTGACKLLRTRVGSDAQLRLRVAGSQAPDGSPEQERQR